LRSLLARVGCVVTFDDITRSIGPGKVACRAVVKSDLTRVVSDILITDQRCTVGAFSDVRWEVGGIRAVQWDVCASSISDVARTNVTDSILLADGFLSNFVTTTKRDGTTSFTTSR
jgi:hypothetical protein